MDYNFPRPPAPPAFDFQSNSSNSLMNFNIPSLLNPNSSSSKPRKSYLNKDQTVIGWERVIAKSTPASSTPCQRSLHAGAVWKNYFVVFGGYDGAHRVNDLHSFDFNSSTWRLMENISAPSPRDRHVATVFENNLYIFGGFDGMSRVNDLHAYDLENNKWQHLAVHAGTPPTPRHSHAAVVYKHSMFVFGGYDGSYKNDFHEFDFITKTWRQVPPVGDVPRARYRGTCVISGDAMILHGGHDGNRHMQDTHVFDFITMSWSTLLTEGPIPSPRDSHVAVVHDKSMFLYGGSTGSAMGDFHELKLEFRRVWSPVLYANNNGTHSYSPRSTNYLSNIINNNNISPFSSPNRSRHSNHIHSRSSIINANSGDMEIITPGARFCHVGVVYDSCFYIFGGYDGSQRLNDFLRYRFNQNEPEIQIAPSTILMDLKRFVNNDLLSDIRFIVEDQTIHAHKLLEYLYTDDVDIGIENAMDLFQAADRFAIDRLKKLCEQEMINAISIETAAHILYTADVYNAENLREKCMKYILLNFDEISRTSGFEEMGRTNVEL
eukprot:gene11891-15909_t